MVLLELTGPIACAHGKIGTDQRALCARSAVPCLRGQHSDLQLTRGLMLQIGKRPSLRMVWFPGSCASPFAF